jgi:hypothetical protein
LTRALLATGDYQRQRQPSGAWLFGTGSAKNESVWRDLLTAGSRKELAPTRKVLSTFLDALAPSDDLPVAEQLNATVAAWIEQREAASHFDWRYYLMKYPAKPEEGATGIFYAPDGKLGYSLCMLRRQQRNSHYRDPILLAVWRQSEVAELADDPWFTGYEYTPRWLRLVRSQAGMRCVEEGFELAPPTSKGLSSALDAICNARNDIEIEAERILVRIPQTQIAGEMVDNVDRVQIGAELLKELASAEL